MEHFGLRPRIASPFMAASGAICLHDDAAHIFATRASEGLRSWAVANNAVEGKVSMAFVQLGSRHVERRHLVHVAH